LAQEATATILLYTHPDCNYSDAQRADFVKDGVQFTEIDISVYTDRIEELVKLTGGERITPVMVEGDKVSVGYYGVG
jgi:glutaredoxin